MAKKVLIASNISNAFQAFLQNAGYTLCYDQNEATKDIEAIVTSNKIKIDKTFIGQHPSLKWVARMGSGMEIIDEAYCKAKNIFVCNAPQGIAQAVAEHALAMLIALQKNILKGHNQIAQGLWIREPNRGLELENNVIGLIGYGHTAKAFAKLLSAFNVKILAYDTHWRDAAADNIIIPCSLSTLQAQATIVSYHVPLKDDTINYYKPNHFAQKHILINTSRGEICSSESILAGFASGHLTGACLDVLDFENMVPFSENEIKKIEALMKHNCIITPHIAGYSHNAVDNMCKELAQKLQVVI